MESFQSSREFRGFRHRTQSGLPQKLFGIRVFECISNLKANCQCLPGLFRFHPPLKSLAPSIIHSPRRPTLFPSSGFSALSMMSGMSLSTSCSLSAMLALFSFPVRFMQCSFSQRIPSFPSGRPEALEKFGLIFIFVSDSLWNTSKHFQKMKLNSYLNTLLNSVPFLFRVSSNLIDILDSR